MFSHFGSHFARVYITWWRSQKIKTFAIFSFSKRLKLIAVSSLTGYAGYDIFIAHSICCWKLENAHSRETENTQTFSNQFATTAHSHNRYVSVTWWIWCDFTFFPGSSPTTDKIFWNSPMRAKTKLHQVQTWNVKTCVSVVANASLFSGAEAASNTSWYVNLRFVRTLRSKTCRVLPLQLILVVLLKCGLYVNKHGRQLLCMYQQQLPWTKLLLVGKPVVGLLPKLCLYCATLSDMYAIYID